MKRFLCFLILPFFVLISRPVYCQTNIDFSKLLVGTWKGSYDTSKVTLKFNRNHTGFEKWSCTSKPYIFKYAFKSKNIIVIWDKTEKAYHTLQMINNQLWLKPYPIMRRESIDLINVTGFSKINN